MKKKMFALSCCSVILLAWCNDIANYNDTLVSAVDKCSEAVNTISWEITKNDIEKAWEVCSQSKEIIQNLGAFEEDESFQKSALEYVDSLLSYISTHEKMLPFNNLLKEEFTDEMIRNYNSIILELQKQNNDMIQKSEELQHTQEVFAQNHWWEIEE